MTAAELATRLVLWFGLSLLVAVVFGQIARYLEAADERQRRAWLDEKTDEAAARARHRLGIELLRRR